MASHVHARNVLKGLYQQLETWRRKTRPPEGKAVEDDIEHYQPQVGAKFTKQNRVLRKVAPFMEAIDRRELRTASHTFSEECVVLQCAFSVRLKLGHSEHSEHSEHSKINVYTLKSADKTRPTVSTSVEAVKNTTLSAKKLPDRRQAWNQMKQEKFVCADESLSCDLRLGEFCQRICDIFEIHVSQILKGFKFQVTDKKPTEFQFVSQGYPQITIIGDSKKISFLCLQKSEDSIGTWCGRGRPFTNFRAAENTNWKWDATIIQNYMVGKIISGTLSSKYLNNQESVLRLDFACWNEPIQLNANHIAGSVSAEPQAAAPTSAPAAKTTPPQNAKTAGKPNHQAFGNSVEWRTFLDSSRQAERQAS